MKKLILFLAILFIPTLLWADSVLLHPNANGSYIDFSLSHGTNHYNLVDELDANSPEPTDSFVYKTGLAEEVNSFESEHLDNFSPSFTSIDSVVGWVRAKRTGTVGTCDIMLKSGANENFGTFTPTTTYALYRFKATTLTYFDTDAELDAMEVGVRYNEGLTTGTLTVTQMEVYVYYTAGAGGGVDGAVLKQAIDRSKR